ncbi:MAG: phosphatidylglycerophosphatase [Bryobacterales bacterium]|nr:phosphatidylglycerophosphatase [Bryobacterales bacterium]
MNLPKVLSTWFGCGLAPVAPGTAGSLAAVLLAIPFIHTSPLYLLLAAVLLTPIAIWAADVTARQLSRKDPGLIVIDEVVGQWIALAGATHLNWRSLLLGFALFRLFDVWKPFPARRLEALPGGLGIVADDIMAGIYASLVLFLFGWFNFY